MTGIFARGTTVCLHLANDVGDANLQIYAVPTDARQVTYPILVLGILASGCRWTGTNVAYTQHELEHHFRISDTKYVVVSDEHVPVVQAAVAALKSNVQIILFDDILAVPEAPRAQLNGNNGLHPRLKDLLFPTDIVRMLEHLDNITISDIAVLASTSGTTGMPKMAARTHRSLMLETEAIGADYHEKPYIVRRLMSTPIYHGFSAPEMIFNPLRLGYLTYITKRFDCTFARKVHDFHITEIAAPPAMIMRLLQQTESHNFLQGLRLIMSGGAPLAAEARKRFLDIFHVRPRMAEVWGMTEVGWITTHQYLKDAADGSVGQILPGLKVAVGSEHQVHLPNGIVAGELHVFGAQLMNEYYGSDTATANSFVHHWFKTGDIGFIRQDSVYIIDRAKDLIKVNGWQVAPAELEGRMLESPDVVDAAAIGVGHGVAEHPMIFVVTRNGEMEAEDVIGHLLSRLARYKVIHSEVRFVARIPRSPTGKVLRNELRQLAEQ